MGVDNMSVTQWHERLLVEALRRHNEDPHFRFNLRIGNANVDRLSKGYWFTGTEDYLFFAPFKPNDPNNKTRTIGFVISFDGSEQPKSCYLEIVYGGIADPGVRAMHEKILSSFGGFPPTAAAP